MATLIEQIRAERERQGLSVHQLADRADLQRTHVHQLLNGTRADPRLSTVEALCQALNIPLGKPDAETKVSKNAYKPDCE